MEEKLSVNSFKLKQVKKLKLCVRYSLIYFQNKSYDYVICQIEKTHNNKK